MSKFTDLYNSFMLDFTPQRQHIYEHILIEENQFLKNPNGIFQKIYKIILNLYEKKQYSKEIKIYIMIESGIMMTIRDGRRLMVKTVAYVEVMWEERKCVNAMVLYIIELVI